ncbi:hypothetical protein HRI_001046700 [Hibiscus trionum]|uniref:BTB domain-containing protein n=1 Tax=Hibiscus trionum TaxID=183268 RepID=A0A9W7LQZ0_HIBTR|nr:hypothetical protein HRI_001046700 [Hibiscus trionum]
MHEFMLLLSHSTLFSPFHNRKIIKRRNKEREPLISVNELSAAEKPTEKKNRYLIFQRQLWGWNLNLLGFFVVENMGSVTVAELKTNISGKRSFRPSSSIRHATEWPISDVSSDLKIEIGASSFALHKFPLVSRSGRIRKLMVDAKDAKIARINLSSVPGGPEAFELVAKFCYGINVEITLSNIAVLRCVSHYLEMGEEFAEKNLEARTEAYLKDIVLPNISSTIAVLHRCESLLPISEEIDLVNRLINAIANNACKEQLTSGLLKLDHNFPSKAMPNIEPERHQTGGESLWLFLISASSNEFYWP